MKKELPDTNFDFKNQETMESVKGPLERMKAFGSRLKTNQLRMNTIKGRLEIMRDQVENVEELKEVAASEETEAFLSDMGYAAV